MIVRESPMRDMLRLLVWYPLRWILLYLPVRMGMRVLAFMGDLHFLAARGKRRALTANLRRITRLSPRAEKAVVRAYLRNHYLDHLFIFLFPRCDARTLTGILDIEGLEHLNAALTQGKGAILVHGHLGPVHLPLVTLARMGYPMQQIGNPSDEGLSRIGRQVAFRLRLYYESKIPADIILADGFLRPVFKWLRQNGIVMITGDGSGTQERIGRHEVLPFLGHRMYFPLGPALLATKTKAQILPMFIQPGKGKWYRIIIEPPLTSNLEGEARARDITRKFIRRLEYHILQYPGFMHFLDRFEQNALLVAPLANPKT